MDDLEFILICLAVICAGIVFPIWVNQKFENEYRQKGWSLGWTIVQGILLVLCIYEYEEANSTIWSSLLIALVVLIFISGAATITRAGNMGASKVDTLLAVLAQILSSLGVAFLIILILVLVSGANSKHKKRRK